MPEIFIATILVIDNFCCKIKRKMAALKLLFSSFPSEEDAKNFAKELVAQKLAECVKVMGCSSFYIWEGKNISDHEGLMIAKILDSKLAQVEEFFNKKHPYRIPEFIVVDCDYVKESYLSWAVADKLLD